MHSLHKTLLFCLAVVVCSVPTPVRAQGGDARVLGVVIDVTGRFVPGATVTITNERTGETRTVRSNGDGRYVVAGLKPSAYTIRAKPLQPSRARRTRSRRPAPRRT